MLNLRQEKKMYRKMGMTHPVEMAWRLGCWNGESGKPYRNPYPKGKRHNEFDRGYHLADPLGDHHGHNI